MARSFTSCPVSSNLVQAHRPDLVRTIFSDTPGDLVSLKMVRADRIHHGVSLKMVHDLGMTSRSRAMLRFHTLLAEIGARGAPSVLG